MSRFSYRAGEPVLRGMSFVAEPSKVTALVGPSGGGKSTVLNLILRFYDIEMRAHPVDSHNIVAVSRRSVRHQIAYVGQTSICSAARSAKISRFGKLDASEAEIYRRRQGGPRARLHHGLPGRIRCAGRRTRNQLSGGQRQRIAIARALIKNAPIILLDEATASLDSESERYVQEAIAELCKGRTTLVIAHRLSTIMHADRILVVEGGLIAESGRHDELMRKGGRYASFYRLQLKSQSPAREPVMSMQLPFEK